MPISNTYRVVNYNDPTTIYVHPDGIDENNGSFYKPVKTITRAFALVDSTRKIVCVAPGTYAEAAAVAWPTNDEVYLIGAGRDLTFISSAGTSVFTVTPGVQSGTWEGYIRDVHIDHSAGSAQSGITFSNAAMTKKLIFGIKNCSFEVDTDTDKSINMATHTDTSNSVRIYVSGDGTQVEIEGAIYFNVGNLADRLLIDNCWLMGLITTTAGAYEFKLRLRGCVVPHEGATAGGSGTQKLTSVNTYSWIDFNDTVAEIYAAADTNDFTGSHTEVIVA